MENQNLIEFVRKCFVDVMVNSRSAIVDVLNKNGFPTTNLVSDDELITKSLKGLQISNTLRDDIATLLAQSGEALKMPRKLNFAEQPDGGGVIQRLNANDLISTITTQEFLPAPIFVDCNNFNNFK